MEQRGCYLIDIIIITLDRAGHLIVQCLKQPVLLCCPRKISAVNLSLSPSIYQRAQEEVHSKELKVKLLTDSVNSFIAKAPPTAHDALRSELEVLTANYQRLCSRLDGKCKTLEVGFLFCLFLSFF